MKKIITLTLVLSSFLITSCNNDDDTPSNNSNLTLNLMGLEDLGDDYVYEGWIIVDGSPVSTGTFTSVDFPQTFSVNAQDLASATKFVLSIEPSNDNDPAPSNTKILAGDFSGTTANVTAGIVGDFTSSTGKYLLATPTNDSDADELSGVWFIDNSSEPAQAGLNLPTLEAGWKYEGWVVINGTPVSTGTFTSVSMVDDLAPFSGPNSGPPFPGEDFLTNAPSGLEFPTNLSGATVVVSVEPYPDNSASPFLLKPLAGMIPADANAHMVYDLNQNLVSLPTGSAVR